MDRASLIVARMEERLRAVCEAMPPIEPGAQFWLESDAGPSYCRSCVIVARGKEFDLGAPVEPWRSYCRTEWEDAFYDGIDGGFDTHSDSSQACAICGETLSYILTDDGVEQEIEYYRDEPICVVRDEDTYALDRLALNIWHGSPRHMILGVSLAVSQAFRLVHPTPPEALDSHIGGSER